MVHVVESITGENYRRLIDFAFEHSETVMMVYKTSGYRRKSDDVIMYVRALLMPYILHTKNNSELTPENPCFTWPGTTCGYSDPLDPAAVFYYEDIRIYADMYELSDFVKDYIRSVDGFFYWTQRYDNPEDISFYCGGKCWLYTTAHEYDLYFLDHEDEICRMLDEMHIEYYRFGSTAERKRHA